MEKYLFRPYSPIFPELFEKEKQRIIAHIKTKLLIEHVGSTAVPNLGGKGIIDIAIGVDQKEFDLITKQLQELGYEFRPMHSTVERLFFRADLPDPEEGTRRYHLYLTYPQSKEWKDFLSFRDYLKQHLEEMKHYAELKKKALEEAKGDGEKYRKFKESIFAKILKFE